MINNKFVKCCHLQLLHRGDTWWSLFEKKKTKRKRNKISRSCKPWQTHAHRRTTHTNTHPPTHTQMTPKVPPAGTKKPPKNLIMIVDFIFESHVFSQNSYKTSKPKHMWCPESCIKILDFFIKVGHLYPDESLLVYQFIINQKVWAIIINIKSLMSQLSGLGHMK